jgi:hypothetical protein
MVRTTRVRDIHEASRIATSKNLPVQIIPSDGPVALGYLGYIDICDLGDVRPHCCPRRESYVFP